MMISFTLIANAGILIQWENTRLLLDGIQSEGNYPFSKTPPSLLAQMLTPGETNLYNNLDYLVFSHCHPDHFSPNLVADYLKCNHVKRILYPRGNDSRLEALAQAAQETHTPFWTFSMERGHLHQYRLEKNVTLTTLCTRHMKQLFADDNCSCLLFEILGKHILFLTDCSCEERELLEQFGKVPLDFVFINPYFYYDSQGQSLLEQILKPAKTVIYHLPFPEDDRIRLRTLARQMMRKYPHLDTVLMEEPFQTLEI